MIKAILFDLDGVIIDSLHYHYLAWEQMFNRVGGSVTEACMRMEKLEHCAKILFYASMLELLGGTGRVLGIDVDIRAHNREALEAHPMFRRIDLLEGSSTDSGLVDRVRAMAEGKSVLVCLDSSHTHDHVLRELEMYSPLVGKGGYLVVFDTVVEFMPKALFPDRPWGPGNNPWTAVQAFLLGNDRFEVDRSIPDKLLITVAPDGYLRCVKD